MRKIMVTGGAGFIGSALVNKLCELDYDVTVVDNFFNDSDQPRNEAAQYFILDAGDLYKSKLFKDVNFDYIFHLGEYARVEQSFNDYDTVMDYNYNSFPEVLKFAKAKNAKIIYSGSSTKFANNGKAASPYAFTKAQNTELLKAYSEWYGLDYTIVYFYNVYGYGEKGIGEYATVVQKFLTMKSMGQKYFPVTSPGTQLRNFTHIDDVVEGLILAGFEGQGDEWGIGANEKYSILELVEMLEGEPIMQEPKPGNRMNGELKTTKLKALGWSAKTNLKDYIKEKINE